MAIDMDGTTQLIFGWPSFTERTHKEEKATQRIGSHFNVVVVHGDSVNVYDNMDHLHQGPELTCELLQRTLKRYEQVLFSDFSFLCV